MEPTVVDAVVLASYESRDDRIVHLLTDSPHGRVHALARRARRSPKLFAGNIEPITRCEVTFKLKADEELAVLQRATATTGFATIKGDLIRFAIASVMADVVLHLVPPHFHEPGVFLLLLRALSVLDDPARPPVEDVLGLFELRMLQLSGALPELDTWAGLPEEGRATLQDWMEDRWRPLDPDVRRPTLGFLEHAITELSGRPLKSRGFLDEMLAS